MKDKMVQRVSSQLAAEQQAQMPLAPTGLRRTYRQEVGLTAAAAGAAAGAVAGTHVGIVAGPLGAISGLLPGAIIGGFAAYWAGSTLGAQVEKDSRGAPESES